MPTLPRKNPLSRQDNPLAPPTDKLADNQFAVGDQHGRLVILGDLADDPADAPADGRTWIWSNTTTGQLKAKLPDGTVSILAPFAGGAHDAGTGGNQTITQTPTALSGVTLSLDAGTYIVVGNVNVRITATGTGDVDCRIYVDGVGYEIGTLGDVGSSGQEAQVVMIAQVTVTGTGKTAEIRVSKTNAGGTAVALLTRCTITAFIPAGAGTGGAHSHDAAAVTYTPIDLSDWTGAADPGNVDGALDQLADRVSALGGGTFVGITEDGTDVDPKGDGRVDLIEGPNVIITPNSPAAGEITIGTIQGNFLGDARQFTQTSNLNPDNKQVCGPWLATADMTVTKGYVYCGIVSGAPVAKMVIYSDNAGAPDALIGTSDELTITSPASWKEFTFSTPAIVAAGTSYHLGIIAGGAVVTTLYRTSSTDKAAAAGVHLSSNADTYADGAADPFGTPSTSTYILSAYVFGLGGGGTLDDAYDFGTPGAGRTINTTDGAVLLTTAEADAAPNLELQRAVADATKAIQEVRLTGQTYARLQILADGSLLWSDGSLPSDVALRRAAANLLSLDPGDGLDVDVIGESTTNAGVRIDDQLELDEYLDLAEQAGDPTALADRALVYAKDDAGITKVYIRESDGTVRGPLGATGGHAEDHAARHAEGAPDALDAYSLKAAQLKLEGGATDSRLYSSGGAVTVDDGAGAKQNILVNQIELAASPFFSYNGVRKQDLDDHVAAADPHTGYQKESEKGAAGGYASLDGSTLLPSAQLPTHGASKHSETKTAHVAVFTAIDESLTATVLLPRPGIRVVGDSSIAASTEHGALAAIRATAIAGTVGAGTNTILIEADDNPGFASPTILFTIPLNAATNATDATLDNAWASGDIYVRARCSALGGTAPKDVTVMFYYSETLF